jgi:general secretion pathway protein H
LLRIRNSRQAGFTLLELMVVLIVLSLLAGLLMPRIGAGWRRMEDREFLQEFIHTLRRARLLAMNSGQVVAFRINGEERRYDMQAPPEKPIPPNVDIYADGLEEDPETADRLMFFFPDGSFAGNDVEIAFDQERYFLITLHPLLGSVRWSRVEPRQRKH